MNCVVLPVHYGARIVADTWVDEDIADLLIDRRIGWAGGYAVIGRKLKADAPRVLGLVHRFVAGLVPGDGLRVHHINEDRLDNRRQNLVVVETEVEHGALPHPWRATGFNPSAHHYRESGRLGEIR